MNVPTTFKININNRWTMIENAETTGTLRPFICMERTIPEINCTGFF